MGDGINFQARTPTCRTLVDVVTNFISLRNKHAPSLPHLDRVGKGHHSTLVQRRIFDSIVIP